MLTRIGLATAVALASAAAIALIASSAPARGGSATLMPDLVTLPIPQEAVFVEPDEKGTTVLRLSNEIGNRANGPIPAARIPMNSAMNAMNAPNA